MAEEAGEDNFFLFGLTADQVAGSRGWYSPYWHYEHEPETRAALDLILSGDAKKGDVLGTARIAGIMAAKRTHELIPLCHPLAIAKVTLDITPDAKLPGCIVQATVKVVGPTGVEMEALTAVSVACLTIYDMIKAVERGVRIPMMPA